MMIHVSITNDGNSILREIDVAHPAAKNMIELSRTQDEECGDGTTSVIILGTSISPSPSHVLLLSCN
jgi:T-complex protein 1 subunit gamma